MLEPKLEPIAVNKRSREAVLIVLGYLSEDGANSPRKWVDAIRSGGFGGSLYSLWWDSSKVMDLLSLAVGGLGRGAPLETVVREVMSFKADWDQAQANAKAVGREHFWDLFREIPDKQVGVVAYSLGTRVVYYALAEGRKSVPAAKLKELILLGGALRRSKSWAAAAKGVSGKIVNVYCQEDFILSTVFKIAQVNPSSPCGLKPIEFPKILNVDSTGQVKHHWDYDTVLPAVAREHLSWGRAATPGKK